MGLKDLQLRILEVSEWEKWDCFVKEIPHGTIFQTSMYFKVFAEVFRRKVEVLTVNYQQKITAGVVLYPKKRWYINYATLPFLIPHNTILYQDFHTGQNYYRKIKSEQKILDLIQQYIEEHFHFCHLYLEPSVLDVRSFVWKNWLFTPQYSISIPLNKGYDPMDRLPHNQRRHIRKFEKQSAEFIELNDLSSCFEFISQSYSAHHMNPPLKRKDFDKFVTLLYQNQILKGFAITSGNKILAVMLAVEDFPVTYALFSGKDFSHNRSEAELFLHWRVLNYYREKGYASFDLLGAMSPAISRVKLELGGVLYRGDDVLYFRNSYYKILHHLEFRRQLRNRLK